MASFFRKNQSKQQNISQINVTQLHNTNNTFIQNDKQSALDMDNYKRKLVFSEKDNE